MPVAHRTSHQRKSSSKRKPTTITVGARPASRARTHPTASREPDEDSARKKTRTRKSGKDHSTLPSWKQLESKKNRRRKQDVGSPLLGAVSTVRFVVLLAAIGGAFTLYVGHVHATQSIVAKTEQARKLNHQLHLKYNRLKGEFDRMTGPAEIHRRAYALGLVEDATYGSTITVNP